MEAKGSRPRLKKKADLARRSGKEERVGCKQALTPRVYEEGCPSSDQIAFFLSYSLNLFVG